MARTVYTRQSYSGTTPTTATIVGVLSVGATTATLSSATGFPSTTAGGFTATIGLGSAEEEQIFVGTRTGTALSGITRGFNGTSDQTHSANISIKHTSGQHDYDEANLAVVKTVGQATAVGQILVADAANSFAAVQTKTSGQILVGNGTTVASVAVSGDATLSAAGAVTLAASGKTGLGLATSDSPQFAGVNVGHATDTTVTRASAGDIAVEGNTVYRAGGTDVPVADGGTGSSTAAAARTALGVAVGTDVQAYDAELAALAGLTSAADKLPYFTGLGTAAVADFTAAGRALVDDASASAQRTTLGLGTVATQAASAVAITGGTVTGITDLAVADGGTGSSTAAAARTALGVAIGTDVTAYAASNPLGTLGYSSTVSNQSGLGVGPTDLTGLSVTVTAGTSRRLKITGQVYIVASGAAQTPYVEIQVGATPLERASITMTTLASGHFALQAIETPSSGSLTYKLIAGTSGSTFDVLNLSSRGFILVEDIGSA